MQRYAFFDFDGTLSKNYSGREFLHYLHSVNMYPDGCYQEYLEILEQNKSGKLSYADFVETFGRLWAAALKGKTRKEMVASAKEFFEKHKVNIYPESYKLIKLFKDKNYHTVIVSASPTEIIELFAKSMGIDDVYAVKLEIVDDIYTGKLSTKLNEPGGKEKIMLDFTKEHDMTDSYGFGDSVSDIGMLKYLTHPIALNANPELQKFAEKEGWARLIKDTVVEEIRKRLEHRESSSELNK